MTNQSITLLEDQLDKRGIEEKVRKSIRKSKILVVDDKIDDLKAFVAGLRSEGFTNIVEMQTISSVNSVLDGDYDLIVTDIKDVANDISDLDGLGFVKAIKNNDPFLPVVIVSGSMFTAEATKYASMADRSMVKPIKSNDLVEVIDDIMKTRCDPRWAGLHILKHLHNSKQEFADKLKYIDRIKLWHYKRSMFKAILSGDDNVKHIGKIARTVSYVGSAATSIVKLASALSAL